MRNIQPSTTGAILVSAQIGEFGGSRVPGTCPVAELHGIQGNGSVRSIGNISFGDRVRPFARGLGDFPPAEPMRFGCFFWALATRSITPVQTRQSRPTRSGPVWLPSD